uniref:Uncharacterized protein n=1 Tax=Lotharella globosa TaxID=91324 RepID=A0A7S3YVI5_9EUKA
MMMMMMMMANQWCANRPLSEAYNEGLAYGRGVRDMVLSRFTNPKIDDKGLPLADAMVVLSSTMILGIFILTQGIIKPSWLAPMSLAPQWRSLPFLFPALLHGSLLSMCWVIGGPYVRCTPSAPSP